MAAGDWLIGPCREEDLPSLSALEREIFPVPWSEAQFRRELALPLSTVLVAREGREGGLLLGYLVYWVICDEMHLQGLAVRPGQRRQGLGSRLLAAALRQARTQGARRATLEVREGNHPAQRLYEAFGFSLSGRRKGYYGDRHEDALIYWAELGTGGNGERCRPTNPSRA